MLPPLSARAERVTAVTVMSCIGESLFVVCCEWLVRRVRRAQWSEERGVGSRAKGEDEKC